MIFRRHLRIDYVVLHALGFLLFWEWLRPLEVVTDTANSICFVLFIGICFLLYLLPFPFVLTFFVRFFAFFGIIHHLFYKDSFFQTEWIVSFFKDVIINIQALRSFQWFELSDLFRTFLFLILLWILSYLIHYWVTQAYSIFGFYIITIVLLSFLDTFTKYDAKEAVIRTVIIGFFMLALLQIAKYKDREGLSFRIQGIFLLIVVMVASVLLGLQAPKKGPEWPDPVPFLKNVATGSFFQVKAKRIGYGVDDSRLGGSLSQDDTTVFTAEVKYPHYWRVESKDYYTGKGWKVSKNIPRIPVDQDQINIGILENVVVDQNVKEMVHMKQIGSHPHLVYPMGLHALHSASDVQLYVQSFTGKLFSEKDGNEVTLQSYEVTYDYPMFSVETLRKTVDEPNKYIQDIYTQLPDQLPERIFTLAKEIAKDEQTRYDQVKAIESYFSEEGYIYDTEDVAIPNVNQDYVDQFLFETKKGYCDNFSTAMVVMLRTLDIPARWVKGYTQGDFIKSLDAETMLYEVKNSHAHSWVEVYFPQVGWVPFEPTRGFDNLHIFTENAVFPSAPNEPTEELENSFDAQDFEDEHIQDQEKESTSFFEKEGHRIKTVAWIICLLIFVAIIFLGKKKWLFYMILVYYRIRKKDENLVNAFQVLLRLLKLKGWNIERGETLREFALRVDQQFGTDEMVKLTNAYEKMMYFNGEGERESWESNKQYWEKLVKRIVS